MWHSEKIVRRDQKQTRERLMNLRVKSQGYYQTWGTRSQRTVSFQRKKSSPLDSWSMRVKKTKNPVVMISATYLLTWSQPKNPLEESWTLKRILRPAVILYLMGKVDNSRRTDAKMITRMTLLLTFSRRGNWETLTSRHRTWKRAQREWVMQSSKTRNLAKWIDQLSILKRLRKWTSIRAHFRVNRSRKCTPWITKLATTISMPTLFTNRWKFKTMNRDLRVQSQSSFAWEITFLMRDFPVLKVSAQLTFSTVNQSLPLWTIAR